MCSKNLLKFVDIHTTLIQLLYTIRFLLDSNGWEYIALDEWWQDLTNQHEMSVMTDWEPDWLIHWLTDWQMRTRTRARTRAREEQPVT